MRWSGDGGLLYAQLILGGAVDPAYKKERRLSLPAPLDLVKPAGMPMVTVGLACRP